MKRVKGLNVLTIIITILVITIFSSSTILAENNYNLSIQKDTTLTGKDKALLLELEGILHGNNKGDLMLEEELQRQEAVILLSRLTGVENLAKNYEYKEVENLKDVPKNSFARPYIDWSYQNEYLIGSKHGFKPEQHITLNEFSVALLRALNYDFKENDWEKGIEIANSFKLLDGINNLSDRTINREEVATITVNALNTPILNDGRLLKDKLDIFIPDFKEEKITTKDNLEIINVFGLGTKAVLIEWSQDDLTIKNENILVNDEESEEVINFSNYTIAKFDNLDIGSHILSIKSLYDTEGFKVKNKDFDFIVKEDNAKPLLINYKLDDSGLIVEFNEAVELGLNSVYAKNINDEVLKSKKITRLSDTSFKVELEQNKNLKKLYFDNIFDFSGNKINKNSESLIGEEKEDLKIEDILYEDNTINIVLNQNIKGSYIDLQDFKVSSINGNIDIKDVIAFGNKISLVLNEELENNEYSIKIKNLKDFEDKKFNLESKLIIEKNINKETKDLFPEEVELRNFKHIFIRTNDVNLNEESLKTLNSQEVIKLYNKDNKEVNFKLTNISKDILELEIIDTIDTGFTGKLIINESVLETEDGLKGYIPNKEVILKDYINPFVNELLISGNISNDIYDGDLTINFSEEVILNKEDLAEAFRLYKLSEDSSIIEEISLTNPEANQENTQLTYQFIIDNLIKDDTFKLEKANDKIKDLNNNELLDIDKEISTFKITM